MTFSKLELIFRREAENARKRGDTRIGITMLNLADALMKEKRHGAKEAEGDKENSGEADAKNSGNGGKKTTRSDEGADRR